MNYLNQTLNLNNAFEYLNKTLTAFNKQGTSRILVYTDGYVTTECLNVESNLLDGGMKVISRKYDAKLGKTLTVYAA